MKKTVIMAVTLAVLAACSQEADFTLNPDGSASKREAIARSSTYVTDLTFTALPEADDSATRTILDTDGASVLWIPGDQINIFHQGCDPARFTNINTENGAIATFEGSITTHIITGGSEGSDLNASYYWGLYPYDEEATYEDGVITTTLHAAQTAVAGSFADDLFITLGRSETTEMPFYNVCSGIKFSLDRDDIRKVTFTADGGQPLAGRFSVGFDEETEKPVVLDVLEGTSSIVLTPSDGGYFLPDTWYYVVTLPQTLENEGGFTFTFTLEGDEGLAPIRMRSTASLSLNRSNFRKTAMKVGNVINPDIETAAVREFLESESIQELYTTDTEYTQSLKGSGVSSSPAPVSFTWAATGERTLYIATDETFSDVVKTASVGSSTTSSSIYNLVPGVTYYCRTVSANGYTYWETSFVPVGPFRALSVGVSNARDLGGWTTMDGYTVKYGKLFRGANGSSSSAKELLSLGAAVEMDLRGYTGAAGSPNSSSFYGAELINRPVYQFMYKSKSGVSADDYQQAIREIIQCLQQDKGVYFHCIQGADRTGTLSWLILSLLGVDEANLSKEYELTSSRTRNNSSQYPFKQLVFYIKTFTTFEDPDTGEVLEAQSLQDMTTFWAMTKHKEESDKLGPFNPLTREEIETLKTLLLEGYGE